MLLPWRGANPPLLLRKVQLSAIMSSSCREWRRRRRRRREVKWRSYGNG
ncbi:hypothetical protein E2C01_096216 [Portunus trituberculatus]|uniref:Uncharacterized protein n=1 Tax=Portunus trituberculatus TaxID=210409 RepID=A0A5B7JXD9_PORTR|nr:hypothetical protein [Portunus trituberculatus]